MCIDCHLHFNFRIKCRLCISTWNFQVRNTLLLRHTIVQSTFIILIINLAPSITKYNYSKMSSQIKLLNLPWTFTRQELTRFLSRTLNTRVRFSKILYDKQNGLSRGIGVVQLDNDQITRDMLRRGTLNVDGRNVIVVKGLENNNRQVAS